MLCVAIVKEIVAVSWGAASSMVTFRAICFIHCSVGCVAIHGGLQLSGLEMSADCSVENNRTTWELRRDAVFPMPHPSVV